MCRSWCRGYAALRTWPSISTTPRRRSPPEVIEAMGRAMREHFANPSSLHGLGAAAARALAAAREEVAALVHVEPEEIVFTSGGTEADALGVLGAARAARGRHLVVSALEHPAVFNSARAACRRGLAARRVPPEPDGCVTADAVLAAVRPDTAVVAVMLVNNEIGTVQPIAEIAPRPARARAQAPPARRRGAVRRARPLACARAPTPSPSPRTSCTAPRAPARSGCARARGSRRSGSAAGRSAACARAPRTCRRSSGFGVAAALAREDVQAARARVRRAARSLEAPLCAAGPRPARACPRPRARARRTSPRSPSRAARRAAAARARGARRARVGARPARAHAREQPGPARPSRRSASTTTGVLRFSLSRVTTADDVERAVAAADSVASAERPSRSG